MKASNLIRALAIAAGFLAVSSGASAQSLLSTANVDVSVTLTSQCKWATSAPASMAVNFGTYTAFQVAAKTPAAPQTFAVQCTRNFGTSPTVTWDTAGGTAAGVGVVAGLQYALSVSAGAPTAGTAASTSTIGTPDAITYTLSGSMPAGQAGDASLGATATRTLTMTF